MNITFIPNRSITLVTSDFRVLTATSDNPNWSQIEMAVRANDEKTLIKLISMKDVIVNFGTNLSDSGEITIKGNNVFYRGEKLYGEDVNRIIAYLKGGFPEDSLIAFLESKLRNPDPTAVPALYSFLENKQMPLTANGTVLGYKGVSGDYNSINSGDEPLISGIRNSNGTICNKIGQIVQMDRRYVCADHNNPCAPGLHIGSKNYAKGWGPRVVIVEFLPENVVSVPRCEHEKLRACKYRVVGELNETIILGDTYNNDFVRPTSDTEDPDVLIEPEVDETPVKRDYAKLYNVSDWSKGQSKGFKDGKAHAKRKFYEVDRGSEFKNSSKEFVDGYLVGYRDGRNS